MKKGFWTGLLAFIIAKVLHLIITALLGFIFGTIIGDKPILWDIVYIIDNPLVGLVFLIFATTFIYKKLTKNNKSSQVYKKNDKSSLSSEDLDKKNEVLKVVDKIVESQTSKTDAVSNYNDNSDFKVNIETSWGGEEPSS